MNDLSDDFDSTSENDTLNKLKGNFKKLRKMVKLAESTLTSKINTLYEMKRQKISKKRKELKGLLKTTNKAIKFSETLINHKNDNYVGMQIGNFDLEYSNIDIDFGFELAGDVSIDKNYFKSCNSSLLDGVLHGDDGIVDGTITRYHLDKE